MKIPLRSTKIAILKKKRRGIVKSVFVILILMIAFMFATFLTFIEIRLLIGLGVILILVMITLAIDIIKYELLRLRYKM